MVPSRKILLPLINPSEALPYLRLAALLLSPEGKILALRVIEIPDEESLSVGAEQTPAYRASLEELESRLSDRRVELKTLVRVSRRLREGIIETAKEEGCDLLLLPWKGYAVSPDSFFGSTTDQLLQQPPCNTIVVRAPGFTDCRRILFPVRGGPYAEFALESASRLATSLDAEVTVLHCEERSLGSGIADRAFKAFLGTLQSYPQVRRLLTVQGDPKSTIIVEAKRHDMLVVGATANPDPRGFFLGPIVEHLASETQMPLLVFKTPEPFTAWLGVDRLETPKPISEIVDKWFAENTFHRSEFDDLDKLMRLKEKRRSTISLGLPALNEAETVGKIIRTFKERLQDEIPLLDEIVLIDSGSTDDTVKITQDIGIPVYVHQEILPGYGSYRGKGEALWKSLYVLNGDIIIWIDTDIKNIHAGFVSGIVGPLLKEPGIQYVKGFYRRPLKVDGKIYAEGGGRVTELTARPFLNLFFQELSGIIQPLAGEYGGRREALERVPFFTGYGVETGLLIDLFHQFGLRGIAQVDLEERVHRNQSLSDLSQMSFAIMQVFMERLQEKNVVRLLEGMNPSMKLIKHRRRTYALELKEIRDHERPPMISIPEYRARRQEISSAKTA